MRLGVEGGRGSGYGRRPASGSTRLHFGRVFRDLSTRWGSSKDVVLLTGDLMNEYVADYEPAIYKDTVYYEQPRLGRDWRRRAFAERPAHQACSAAATGS